MFLETGNGFWRKCEGKTGMRRAGLKSATLTSILNPFNRLLMIDRVVTNM